MGEKKTLSDQTRENDDECMLDSFEHFLKSFGGKHSWQLTSKHDSLLNKKHFILSDLNLTDTHTHEN